MYKELEKIIKQVKGNILAIEMNDTLINFFNNNNMVNLYLITSSSSTAKKNTYTISTKEKKNINIKKLRRYINKKSVDYLFCNIDGVMKFYKYIIKDTIYINNQFIYVYSNNVENKDFIINKYKRYNVKIQVCDYRNGYLLKINNTHGKNNPIKDKLHFIKDTFYNLAEAIGNILIS